MYYNYIMGREFRNTNYENYLKDKNKTLHFDSKEYNSSKISTFKRRQYLYLQ